MDSDASFRIHRAYAVAMALGFHADARQPESDECLEDSAAARIAAFLGGGRAPAAIIHCKYEVDLFCGQARGRGSEDGTFSPSWGVPWCPQGPKKVVEDILEI